MSLEYALYYAERGFYVFPIQPCKKIPYEGMSWKEVSTNDVNLIKKVGSSQKYKGCNWALDCGKSNVFVIDIDNKPGKDGIENSLKLRLAAPDFMVETPSGGYHYYYKNENFGNSSERIAKGIDTRGIGGYVLIPGSSNGNKKPYRLIKDGDLGVIPQNIQKALTGVKNVFKQNTIPEDVNLDSKLNEQAAIDYLENHAPEAIEGSGGDQTTYTVACRLRDFGLSPEKSLHLMSNHWNNEKAAPPWTVTELQTKINNAYKYARDYVGNSSPDKLFQKTMSMGGIKSASDLKIEAIKKREWILEGRFIPKYVTVTVAPGGAGKSLLSIAEALSVVTDLKLSHHQVAQTGAAWIHNAEDPLDELDRRIAASKIQNNLKNKQIENLYYSSGHSLPFKLAAKGDKGAPAKNEKLIKTIIENIKKRNVRLFIIDPLVRTHFLNENDNEHMDFLMSIYSYIAEQANCAIHIIHHTAKGKNEHGNADAARGASAIINAARVAQTFYVMDDKECKLYGIQPENRFYYSRLTDAKANLRAPSQAAYWYKKVSVDIGSGEDRESTGVMVPAVLERIIAEDDDAFIKKTAIECVPDGASKSIYTIAAYIHGMHMIKDSARSIQRKIEKMFVFPVETENFSYCLTTLPDATGKDVKQLTSVYKI